MKTTVFILLYSELKHMFQPNLYLTSGLVLGLLLDILHSACKQQQILSKATLYVVTLSSGQKNISSYIIDYYSRLVSDTMNIIIEMRSPEKSYYTQYIQQSSIFKKATIVLYTVVAIQMCITAPTVAAASV
jgi:hypothetical protein